LSRATGAWEICLAANQNQLLELLPRKNRARLLGLCEEVELVMSQVLCECGTSTRYAYFPTKGYISLVTPIDGKPVLEVGMVGSEGMLGTQLVLGVGRAPLHALVQGAGTAWRVASAPFRKELAQSRGLRRNLDRYVQVTMVQLGSSAGG